MQNGGALFYRATLLSDVKISLRGTVLIISLDQAKTQHVKDCEINKCQSNFQLFLAIKTWKIFPVCMAFLNSIFSSTPAE